MLPAATCSHDALLLAVHEPEVISRTVPLPAGLPTTTELVASPEIVLVNEKVAMSPLALAVTVNGPAIPLAVSTGATAFPFGSVRIGIGGAALNVPEAPL